MSGRVVELGGSTARSPSPYPLPGRERSFGTGASSLELHSNFDFRTSNFLAHSVHFQIGRLHAFGVAFGFERVRLVVAD
jgi:hypothetical protein